MMEIILEVIKVTVFLGLFLNIVILSLLGPINRHNPTTEDDLLSFYFYHLRKIFYIPANLQANPYYDQNNKRLKFLLFLKKYTFLLCFLFAICIKVYVLVMH